MSQNVILPHNNTTRSTYALEKKTLIKGLFYERSLPMKRKRKEMSKTKDSIFIFKTTYNIFQNNFIFASPESHRLQHKCKDKIYININVNMHISANNEMKSSHD